MDRQDHRLLEANETKGKEELGSMAACCYRSQRFSCFFLPSRRNLFCLATRGTTERNETPSVDGSSQIHQKPLRVFPDLYFSSFFFG